MEERQERIMGIIGLGAVGILLFAFKGNLTSPAITTQPPITPPTPPNPNTNPPDEPPPIPKPPEEPKPPVEEPKIPPQTLQAYDELCKLIEDNIYEEGGVLKFIDKAKGEKEGFAWMEKWGYLVPIFSPTPTGIVSAKKWMDIQLMSKMGRGISEVVSKVYIIKMSPFNIFATYPFLTKLKNNRTFLSLLAFTKKYPFKIGVVELEYNSGRSTSVSPGGMYIPTEFAVTLKIITNKIDEVLNILRDILKNYSGTKITLLEVI